MCLYPKLIPNKRYLPTKKNGGVPPVCPDERLRYVTAACGDCYECRKQKQRQWVVRMSEENRQTPNAYFLTLTIDDKSYKQLKQKYKLKDNNDIATKAIRLCLERVRKLTGKSVKHWFITELGHEKTERLHLQWIVRMSEENRQTPNAYFLTLTIDDKSYKQLKQKYKLKDNNDIATKAIRLCLERVRRLTGKSVKHWFITELGHEKTERLHLHGILFTNEKTETKQKIS